MEINYFYINNIFLCEKVFFFPIKRNNESTNQFWKELERLIGFYYVRYLVIRVFYYKEFTLLGERGSILRTLGYYLGYLY